MWEIHQQPPPRQLHTLLSAELELLCLLGWLDCGPVVDHTLLPCHEPHVWKLSLFSGRTHWHSQLTPLLFSLPLHVAVSKTVMGAASCSERPLHLGNPGGVQCASPGKERSRGSREVTGPPAGLDHNPELQGWGQKAAALGLPLIHPVTPLIWSTNTLQSMNCLKTHVKLLYTYTFLGRHPTHFTIWKTLWSHQSRPHRPQPEAESWHHTQAGTAHMDLRRSPAGCSGWPSGSTSPHCAAQQNPQNHIRSCKEHTPPPPMLT